MNLTDNKIFYGFDFSLLQGGVAGVIVVRQPDSPVGLSKEQSGQIHPSNWTSCAVLTKLTTYEKFYNKDFEIV